MSAATQPMGREKAQAARSWDDLRSAFTRLDEALQHIIDARAWEPLGYNSFAEAWASEMRGVRLATEIKAHVVYQMISDGLDDQEVFKAVGGVGSGISPDGVEELRRKKSIGVPPEMATTVRRHLRKRPTRPRFLHLELRTTEYTMFAAAAERAGVDMIEYATEAVRKAFEAL